MDASADSPPLVFPWVRYWAAAEQVPLTVDGYLLPPGERGWGAPKQSVELRSLAELAGVPCLVLLGAPGLGKSNELRQERDRLAAANTPGEAVLHVDLKNHDAALFREAVFEEEKFIRWHSGEHALTLMLDSLDECWEQVRGLIPTLLLKLKPLTRAGHPELRLRLGCRAAEWRADSMAKLEEVFGKAEKGEPARVQIHQLAPLTCEDVMLAAQGIGLGDAEQFLADLASHELSALAAHPLTLDLLLTEAKEGRSLGPTRADVYRRGTLHLAHDPHEQAGAPTRNPHTTQEGRRKIAARLAAQGVLSRRYLYRLPLSKERPSSFVIEPAELWADAGGDVGDGKTASGLDLGPDAMRETYRCGLFRGAGHDCVTWQHQAYAEFLAAEFLATRKPVRNENLTRTLLGLISDVSAAQPRIYPPLEELALWLAELHPPLFEELLPANAEVLLRCDSRTLTEARRARVVDLYFKQLRLHEAEPQDGQTTLPLTRLKHAGLTSQLRTVLLNRAEPAPIRRTSITIAQACDCHGLASDLIEVIFTADEDVAVSHAAAWQLRRWVKGAMDASQFAPALCERLLAAPDRPDTEILGCVLPMLWPAFLSTEELLPFLNRSQPKLSITSYDRMFRTSLIERIRPEDMPIILRWGAGLTLERGRLPTERSAEFIQQVARLAFEHIDVPDILPALVQLVAGWGHYSRPSILPVRDERPLPQQVRRRIWSTLLVELDSETLQDVFSSLSEPRGVFFVHEDLEWAVSEAIRTAGTPVGGWWNNLVQSLTRWMERADIEVIWPLVEASEEFAALVRHLTTWKIVDDHGGNWRKEQHYRDEEAAQQRRELKPIEARFSDAADLFEQGREDVLWGITEALFLVEDERGEFQPPHGRDESPIRRRLPETFHSRFAVMGRLYLEAVTPPTPDELLADKTLRKHICVVQLAGYFAERDSTWAGSLPVDWWARWFPALLVYQRYAFEDEDDLLWSGIVEAGRRKCPEGFYAALRLWLSTGDAVGIEHKSWFGGSVIADPVVREILRDHALLPATNRSAAHAFGRFLLNADDTLFEQVLAQWIQERAVNDARDAALAAALLLAMCPQRWAVNIAGEMAEDVAWAKAVMTAMNTPGELSAGWIMFLPPTLTIRLWETFKILAPDDPWQNQEGFGGVTLEQEIGQLRSYLLNHLNAQSSPEAVAALEGLMERRPADAVWLGRMLAHVRRAARREGWTPMGSQESAKFLSESGPRLIRTLGDLGDAVMDSLERYQADLRGPNSSRELWHTPHNEYPFYRPKEETELSDCLVRHLRRDLGALGVWGEREVEVRRGTATEKGDNPDIVIIVPNPAYPAQPLRLYVEVKCAWNVDALSGLGKQLFERYLRTADCGVYVLAHYACRTWNAPEDWRRGTSLHRLTKENAASQLRDECARVQALTDKRLAAFFLDASL